MKIVYDLHIHTNNSDGSYQVKQIVEMALKQGLKGISITDHDNFVNSDFLDYIKNTKLEFIQGVEFSSFCHNVHIIGYGINIKNQNFLDFIKDEKEKRKKACIKMCEKSIKYGVPVSFEEIKNEFGENITYGRPHISSIMIKKGYVKNIYEAFNNWLKRDAILYEGYKKFFHYEIIEKILSWDGFPVLAHFGVVKEKFKNKILDECIQAGLKGIEVYYPRHTKNQVLTLYELAKKTGLAVTGGSDFHGIIKPDIKLGCSGIDETEYKNFIKQLQK